MAASVSAKKKRRAPEPELFFPAYSRDFSRDELHRRLRRSATASMTIAEIADLIRHHGETLLNWKQEIFRSDDGLESISNFGDDLIELAKQLKNK